MGKKSAALVASIKCLQSAYITSTDRAKILVDTGKALDAYEESKADPGSVGLKRDDLEILARNLLKLSFFTYWNKVKFHDLVARDRLKEAQRIELTQVLANPVIAIVFERLVQWVKFSEINQWHSYCEAVITTALTASPAVIIPVPVPITSSDSRPATETTTVSAAGVGAAGAGAGVPTRVVAATEMVAETPVVEGAGAGGAFTTTPTAETLPTIPGSYDIEVDSEDEAAAGPTSRLVTDYPLFTPPSDHLHAVLCLASYVKSLEEIKTLLDKEEIETGWELWKQFSVNKDHLLPLATSTATTGVMGSIRHAVSAMGTAIKDLYGSQYRGLVFINRRKKQAILVHQGDDLSNLATLRASLESIALGKPSVHQAASIAFAKQVIHLCKKRGLSLSVTGHGLGGWLTHLTIYHCHDSYLDYPAIKGVSFDHPGFAQMNGTLKSNIEGSRWTSAPVTQQNIVTYLSYPNLINCTNLHRGTVYRLSPRLSGDWFKPFTLDAHSMVSLVEAFTQNILQVYDWPTLDLSENMSTVENLAKLPGVLGDPLNAGIAGLKSLWALTKVGLTSIKAAHKGKWPTLIGGAQYQDFYNVYASADTDYNPTPETEEARYLLAYDSHYKVEALNPYLLEIRHFDPDMRKAVVELHKLLSGKEVRLKLTSDMGDRELRIPAFSLENLKIEGEEVLLIKLEGKTVRRFYEEMIELRAHYTAVTKTTKWLEPILQRIHAEIVLQTMRKQVQELYRSDYRLLERAFPRRGATSSELIEDMYVGLSIIQETEYNERQKEIEQGLTPGQVVPLEGIFTTSKKPSQRIFIQGGPGFGKTTACQHIVYQWAEGKLFQEFDLLLWIPLREWEAKREEPEYRRLVDFIQKKYLLSELDREALIQALKSQKTRVLWLLDGLDELHTEKMRRKVIHDLMTEITEAGDSAQVPYIQNWILTSRPDFKQGIHYELGLEITGFNPEARETFIKRYFALEARDSLTVAGIGAGAATVSISSNLQKARNLYELIQHNPEIREVSRSPILLELLCFYFDSFDSESAEVSLSLSAEFNIAQLYASCMEKLAKEYLIRTKRYNRITIEALTRDKLQEEVKVQEYFHKQIALAAVELGKLDLEPKLLGRIWQLTKEKQRGDFSFDLILEYGCLRRLGKKEEGKGETTYTRFFIHRSVQEFYAAQAWVEAYFSGDSATKAKAREFFVKKKLDPSTRLVWQFVAGLLSNERHINEFFYLLSNEPRDLSEQYGSELLLSCYDQLTKSTLTKVPQLQKRIQAYIQALIQQGVLIHSTKAQSWLLSQFKAEWGTEEHPGKRNSLTLISLLKSLKQQNESEEVYWLAGLEYEHPEIAYLCAQKYLSTETAWTEAQQRLVLELLAHRYSEVRRYASAKIKEKLGKLNVDHERILVAILSHPDLLVQIRLELLEYLIDFEYVLHDSIPRASTMLKIPHEIKVVARGLGKYEAQFLPYLRRNLEASDKTGQRFYEGKTSTAVALIKLENVSPRAMQILLETLKGKKENDDNEYERARAAKLLGKLGDSTSTVVEALVIALTDEKAVVQIEAAKALTRLGKEIAKALTILVNVLNDESSSGQQLEVAKALGNIGKATPEVVKALLDQLVKERLDRYWDRQTACIAQSLIQLGQTIPEEVVDSCLIPMSKPTARVSYEVLCKTSAVLVALGKESAAALETLMSGLRDVHKDEYERSLAAEAVVGLQRINPDSIKLVLPEITSILVRILLDEENAGTRPIKNEYWSLQCSAARALGNLGKATPEIVEALVHALTPTLSDTIVLTMRHGGVSLPYHAAEALGKLGVKTKRVLELVMRFLSPAAVVRHFYDTFIPLTSYFSLSAGGVSKFLSPLASYLERYHEITPPSIEKDILCILKSKIFYGGMVPEILSELSDCTALIRHSTQLNVEMVMNSRAQEIFDFVASSKDTSLATKVRINELRQSKVKIEELMYQLNNSEVTHSEKLILLQYLASLKVDKYLLAGLLTWFTSRTATDSDLRYHTLLTLSVWYRQEEFFSIPFATDYLHGAALIMKAQCLYITAENKLIWRIDGRTYDQWKLTPAQVSKIRSQISSELRGLAIPSTPLFTVGDLSKSSLELIELKLNFSLGQDWLLQLEKIQRRLMYVEYEQLLTLFADINSRVAHISNMAHLAALKKATLILLLAIFLYRGNQVSIKLLKRKIIDSKDGFLKQLDFLNIAQSFITWMIGIDTASHVKAKKILDKLALQLENPADETRYAIDGFDDLIDSARTLVKNATTFSMAYPKISTSLWSSMPIPTNHPNKSAAPPLTNELTKKLRLMMRYLSSTLDSETLFYQHAFARDERLTEELARLGVKRKAILGDGHCQFRAVASELLRCHPEAFPAELLALLPERELEALTLKLRELTVAYMTAHRDEFMDFFEPGSPESNGCADFDTYLEEIRDTKAFGGELTVRALSKVLNHSIVVLTPDLSNEEAQVIRPHIYQADASDVVDLNHSLYLIYNSINHYDCIEEAPSAIFIDYLNETLSHGGVAESKL